METGRIALDVITAKVCVIAREAGAYMREERKKFSLSAVERKHEHDYVSYVDKSSEKMIVAQLKALLPEAGFVTEEGSAQYQHEEYVWVVDPLDGTTNYVHGYMPYAVSISLCRGTEILSGVVYDAPHDECFFAWKGGGAWLNGDALHVSDLPIREALLGLELPYNAEGYRELGMSLIRHFFGYAGGIRMNGSAAMALCNVAAGRLDGWIEKYLGRWDYMAGAIIIEEAGGKVTDFNGSSAYQLGDEIIASNGIIHDELVKTVKKYNHA
jgi:myo-inositol-1(or 4)-monophosphatase